VKIITNRNKNFIEIITKVLTAEFFCGKLLQNVVIDYYTKKLKIARNRQGFPSQAGD